MKKESKLISIIKKMIKEEISKSKRNKLNKEISKMNSQQKDDMLLKIMFDWSNTSNIADLRNKMFDEYLDMSISKLEYYESVWDDLMQIDLPNDITHDQLESNVSYTYFKNFLIRLFNNKLIKFKLT